MRYYRINIFNNKQFIMAYKKFKTKLNRFHICVVYLLMARRQNQFCLWSRGENHCGQLPPLEHHSSPAQSPL